MNIQNETAEGKVPLAAWCEEVNPWGCFKDSEVSRDFKNKTGRDAPWRGYKAKIANETVGQFKGLQKPLEMPGDELVMDGWKIVLSVWKKYTQDAGLASDAEINCIGYLNGRGSIADACIRSMKRAGI